MENLRLRPLLSAPAECHRSWIERLLDWFSPRVGRAADGGAGGARRALGRRGEELAFRFLQRQGYQILERNGFVRLGGRRWMEFDLIAREGGELVFLEVKTRRKYQAGFAAERAVHPAKRRRLLRGAQEYRRRRNLTGRFRFDIVTIYAAKTAAVEIRLLRDAFFPGRR